MTPAMREERLSMPSALTGQRLFEIDVSTGHVRSKTLKSYLPSQGTKSCCFHIRDVFASAVVIQKVTALDAAVLRS